MYRIADRKGTVKKQHSFQDKLLEFFYGTFFGRLLLKPFITPVFSKLGGKVLDSRVSKIFIRPYIRAHSICMDAYEKAAYRSYNDFFKRRLLKGAREIDLRKNSFISPCDSKLCVYKIDEESQFSIKHTKYTVKSLLRNNRLAEKYAGGYIWIFRLSVEDYHHYVYIDDGRVSSSHRICGVFHTVNPVANDSFPIYKENTREYSLLKSENFGTVLQMEVGALLVGKIENHPVKGRVSKGQEKGNFAFGGSTVILMTQKGKAFPDEDIRMYSLAGIETAVTLGEHIGSDKPA